MSEGIANDLRREIEESGWSVNALASESGVQQAALSRFMNGKAGLSLESIERLAEVLGLRLSRRRGRRVKPINRRPDLGHRS